MIADGTSMSFARIGFIVTFNLSLFNVYHIPNLTLNLVYVGQLCDSGNIVTFTSYSSFMQDLQSQKLIWADQREGELYVLNELKVSVNAATSIYLSSFRLSPSSSFYL